MNFSANTTMANTSAPGGLQPICVDSSFSRPSTIVKIFSLSLIAVVSLIGNILIIFVVYKNHSLRRTINFFIVNIAISDLIIPTFVLPKMIVDLSRGDDSWLLGGTFGLASCKLIYFFSDVSPTVSIISLIFMTVDRFLAVVFPLRVTLMNSKRRYCLIALSWIISAAFFVPYFYAMKVIELPNGKSRCVLKWSPVVQTHIQIHKIFSSAISILFLVIPFLTLSILYTIILMKTRQTPELIRNNTCVKQRLKQKQTAKRVTLMAFMIVLIFGLCWGPYYIFLFLFIFVWNWQRPAFCQFPTFFFAVQFLCYSNAAINPCVYFIFIKNFRRGLSSQLAKSSRRIKQLGREKGNQSDSLLTSLQTTTVRNTCSSAAETCI